VVYVSYEGVKKVTNSYNSLTFWNGCWAGAFAGFTSSWFTGPVELIKCLMQDNPSRYKSSVDCLKQVVRTQGFRGLFVGMFATQVRDIAFFMGQFSFY
jgi:solute carrier family 25 carnitine/acylcarnitine transporter 20/29